MSCKSLAIIAFSATLLGSPAVILAQPAGAGGTGTGGPAAPATSGATEGTVRVPGTTGGAKNPESFIAGGTKTTTGQPAIGTETDGTPQPVPGAVAPTREKGHGGY